METQKTMQFNVLTLIKKELKKSNYDFKVYMQNFNIFFTKKEGETVTFIKFTIYSQEIELFLNHSVVKFLDQFNFLESI